MADRPMPTADTLAGCEPLRAADKLAILAGKLAEAATTARGRGDDVNALFFAIKAAEVLSLAKSLGFKPDVRAALSPAHGRADREGAR